MARVTFAEGFVGCETLGVANFLVTFLQCVGFEALPLEGIQINDYLEIGLVIAYR